MATQTRHTEAMTDAYISGLRLRNALRAQCAIQQLGERWLLHPDNAVTREGYLEVRRARAERIDLRWYQLVGAVQEMRFISAKPGHAQADTEVLPFLRLQHEGGAQ